MNKFESYLYGLILTDGSLYLQSRNRGRIAIELQASDIDLLYQLQQQIPHSSIHTRTRDTNFKKNYQSVIFTNYQKEFRDRFINYGIPLKNKKTIGTVPMVPYSINDFWRGVYDGNGSIGFTSKNEPFVSLVTKSEPLKEELCKLLASKFNIHKNINPNQRDKIFNIVLKNEDAIQFCDFLYENAPIYLQRKYDEYQKMKTWIRTKPRLREQSWSMAEIQYIQTHTIQESMTHLHRTKSSIKTKLWRIRQSNTH